MVLLLSMVVALMVTAVPASAQSSDGSSASDATITYLCPAGATSSSGSGASLVCVVAVTEAVDAMVETTHSCPTGSTVVTGTSGATLECETIESIDVDETVEAEVTEVYSCPVDATGIGAGPTLTCVTMQPTAVEVDLISMEMSTCPDGSMAQDADADPLVCLSAGTDIEIAELDCTDATQPNLVQIDDAQVCTLLAAPTQCPEMVPYVWQLETDAAGQEICRFQPGVASQSDPRYVCPAESTLRFTSSGPPLCIRTDEVEVATTNSNNFNCPDGSFLVATSGGEALCEAETDVVVPPVEVTTYTCPSPAFLEPFTTTCLEFGVRTVSPVQQTNFVCPDGFDLRLEPSPDCVLVTLVQVDPVTAYFCPFPSQIDRSDPDTPVCRSVTVGENVAPVEIPGLICPEDSIEVVLFADGTPDCRTFVLVSVASTTTSGFVCPNGSVEVQSGFVPTCAFEQTVPAVPSSAIECPVGTMPSQEDPALCASIVETVEPVAVDVPACPAGSEPATGDPATPLVCNELEVSLEPSVAITVFRCPVGATPSGSGAATVCVIASTALQLVASFASTSASGLTTYSCPAGTITSGSGAATTCTQTVQTSSTVANIVETGYVCSEGEPVGSGPTTQCEVATLTGTTVPSILVSEAQCPDGSSEQTADPLTCAIVELIQPLTTVVYVCPPPSNAGAGSGAALECIELVPVGAVNVVTYSCPAGAIEAGGADATLLCEFLDSTDVRVSPVAGTRLSCPEGSAPTGAQPITCGEAVAVVTPAVPQPNPTCPDGSTARFVTEFECVVAEVTEVQAASEEIVYVCPPESFSAGEVEADATCEVFYDETFPATPTGPATPQCPQGATASGSGAGLSCIVPMGVWVTVMVELQPICPSRAIAVPGSDPLRCVESQQTVTSATPGLVESCPAGAAADGMICVLDLPDGAEEVVAPSCGDGISEVEGGCVTGAAVPPECPDGFDPNVAGGCAREIAIIVEVAPLMTSVDKCPEGAEWNEVSGANPTCTVEGSETVPVAALLETTAACPAGAVASGSGSNLTCSQSVSSTSRVAVDALSVTMYSCPEAFPVASGTDADLVCQRTIETVVPVVEIRLATVLSASAGNAIAGSTSGDLTFTDPYVCGGGFFGSISGGTAPYTVTYDVANAERGFTLGTFIANTADYGTPPGYVDYTQIPDAQYSVSVAVVDAASQSLLVPDLFSAFVTDSCGAIVVAAPSSDPVVISSTVNALTPVAMLPVASIPAQPALAVTGRGTAPLMWALAMLAAGSLLMGASRSRRLQQL